MKGNLTKAFTGLAILFCIRGQSQSIAPSACNSAGGTYDNPSMYTHFEWNFGELTLTDTYMGPGGILFTNGLLQPCTDKVIPDPEILLFGTNEFKIFPNVTTGPFELDFFLNLSGTMELQLTDAMGRIIEKRKFVYHCCDRIERFDLTRYANGVYFINAVFTPEHDIPDYARVRRQSTFRIVKGGK